MIKDDVSECDQELESPEKRSSLKNIVLPSETQNFDSDLLDINLKVLNEETSEMKFSFDDEKCQFGNLNETVEIANDFTDLKEEIFPIAYEDSWEGDDDQLVDDPGQKTEI
jgi:hypothetical protein